MDVPLIEIGSIEHISIHSVRGIDRLQIVFKYLLMTVSLN